MTYRFFFLTAATVFLLACGSDPAATDRTFTEAELAKQEAAYNEMMEAHDRVMPRMGEIFQLNRSLETQLSGETPTADSTTVRAMIESLTTAEDDMMEWMSELEPLDSLRTELDHAAIMGYIETENQAILRVEKDMNRGLEEGMNLIEIE